MTADCERCGDSLEGYPADRFRVELADHGDSSISLVSGQVCRECWDAIMSTFLQGRCSA